MGGREPEPSTCVYSSPRLGCLERSGRAMARGALFAALRVRLRSVGAVVFSRQRPAMFARPGPLAPGGS
eukprot:2908996-Lingulodinium_polyedra.AAC.1